MEQVLEISVAEMVRREKLARSFNDEMLLIELKGNGQQQIRFAEDVFMRIDALSVILVCEGEMSINIDDTDYRLCPKSVLDLFDLHVFRDVILSPDFAGYHLVLSKSLVDEMMRDSKRLPVESFIARRAQPTQALSDEQIGLLKEMIGRIERSLDRDFHVWKRDLIKNELRGFFLEMGNIIIQTCGTTADRGLSEKDEIFSRFIHLLDRHCTEEHRVDFYARELCVDAPYLSRILKSSTGRPANKWIEDALMRMARIYLHNPEMTLQQIADALHFSDQSAFGKFFKKHTGMSPLQYRKR